MVCNKQNWRVLSSTLMLSNQCETQISAKMIRVRIQSNFLLVSRYFEISRRSNFIGEHEDPHTATRNGGGGACVLLRK